MATDDVAQTFLMGKRFPNRLFVGGLPINTSAQELADFFLNFGAVTETKVIFDECGISKGYGFVTFRSREDIDKVKAMGTLFLKNKKLNIGPAVKKEGPGLKPEIVIVPNAPSKGTYFYPHNIALNQGHTQFQEYPGCYNNNQQINLVINSKTSRRGICYPLMYPACPAPETYISPTEMYTCIPTPEMNFPGDQYFYQITGDQVMWYPAAQIPEWPMTQLLPPEVTTSIPMEDGACNSVTEKQKRGGARRKVNNGDVPPRFRNKKTHVQKDFNKRSH